MKRIIYLASIILLAFSCTKEVTLSPEEISEERPISININTGFLRQKSTVIWNAEAKIDNIHTLIFDSRGLLDYSSYTTYSSELTVTLDVGTMQTGRKTICVFANFPENKFNSVTNLDDLKDITVSYADFANDSKKSTHPAFGMVDVTVTEGENIFTIGLERYVSRIELGTVTYVPDESLEYTSIFVNGYFITNLVDGCCADGTFYSEVDWLNRCGRIYGATNESQKIGPDLCTFKSEKVRNRTYWTGGLYLFSKEMKPGETVDFSTYNGEEDPRVAFTVANYLYFFPNPITEDNMGWVYPFTTRKTRVVLMCTILGSVYYYPVTIDQPTRNKAYTVNYNITKIGSDDPDICGDASNQPVIVDPDDNDDDTDVDITY